MNEDASPQNSLANPQKPKPSRSLQVWGFVAALVICLGLIGGLWGWPWPWPPFITAMTVLGFVMTIVLMVACAERVDKAKGRNYGEGNEACPPSFRRGRLFSRIIIIVSFILVGICTAISLLNPI